VPLQEVAAHMKVMHERVAGIDVHKDMVKVAIRSPGDKPWTRKTEILEFRTFSASSSTWPPCCAGGG
jgi:hypothetical protein